MENKPAVSLSFLLNTADEELDLGLEHFALVRRLRQARADWLT